MTNLNVQTCKTYLYFVWHLLILHLGIAFSNLFDLIVDLDNNYKLLSENVDAIRKSTQENPYFGSFIKAFTDVGVSRNDRIYSHVSAYRHCKGWLNSVAFLY